MFYKIISFNVTKCNTSDPESYVDYERHYTNIPFTLFKLKTAYKSTI